MNYRNAADFSELGDPIELVARFVVRQDWLLKQTDASGVLVYVPGHWGQYQLRVDWQDDSQFLCLHVTLDMLFDDVPIGRLEAMLSQINEHLLGISDCHLKNVRCNFLCSAIAWGRRRYS